MANHRSENISLRGRRPRRLDERSKGPLILAASRAWQTVDRRFSDNKKRSLSTSVRIRRLLHLAALRFRKHILAANRLNLVVPFSGTVRRQRRRPTAPDLDEPTLDEPCHREQHHRDRQ